uniref:Uncharacterized protein n=1 Tax=Trypanosoma congolense (strain IL3000) TaxID=1068625 RepID=G0ULZ8_TRYCI|nr:hypothetical protein, unlikely [Trypanosoma congolense IL3000]
MEHYLFIQNVCMCLCLRVYVRESCSLLIHAAVCISLVWRLRFSFTCVYPYYHYCCYYYVMSKLGSHNSNSYFGNISQCYETVCGAERTNAGGDEGWMRCIFAYNMFIFALAHLVYLFKQAPVVEVGT